MATEIREVKYSYPAKELKIFLVLMMMLIIYYLIIQEKPRSLSNDESDWSIIVVVGIIWFYKLFQWMVWKLAGGWKE